MLRNLEGFLVIQPAEHEASYTQVQISKVCSPAADARFGPAVRGCRDDFDFTLTFEFYVFCIAPCILFIVCALPRLLYLRLQPPVVNGRGLKAAKLLALVTYSALQLPILFYWPSGLLGNWPVGEMAFGTTLVAGVVASILSASEHKRSLRPSGVLNIYLLCTLLFDVAILRSFWLTTWLGSYVAPVFTMATGVKFVAMCLEAVSKRAFFCEESDKMRSPQELCGIYSQSLYLWLNGLMMRGFRKKLEPADLYLMDETLAASNLDSRFWSNWDSSRRTNNKLLMVMLSTFKWEALAPIAPRVALIAFTVCQPLLVRTLLEYLQDPEGRDLRVGYGIAGAYFVVYTGIAVTDGLYWVCWYQCLTSIRGTLMTAIFRKTTEIPTAISGDKAAVTLMSADIDQIVNGLRDINELWATIFQIAVAVYLLEREIGYACVAPVVVSALAFWATTYLSKFMQKYQKQWLEKIQPKVAVISSVLSSMKNIKLLGLTAATKAMVTKLRLQEVNQSKNFRLLGAYTSTIALFPLLLSPVAAFALYAIKAKNEGVTLDVSKLFTSMSILLILSQPLYSLFGSLIKSRTVIGCFDRIDKYLQTPSRKDYRTFIEDSTSALNLMIDIELKNLDIGWEAEKPSILTNVNLVVKRSDFVVVTGPTGSGKSTLLKACLREAPRRQGEVRLSRQLQRIAWCEQSPWLINDTIQKNIIGFLPLEKGFYNSVVHACELEEDFQELPKGDQTAVGSNGATLSGGQKLRIAIARAVYSRPEIVFMDDVFSGLDVVTTEKISKRLFSKDGLFRQWGTTVVLATHTIDLLSYADYIVSLSDGGISEQGTLGLLQDAGGYISSVYRKRLETSTPSGLNDSENQSLKALAKKKSEKETAIVQRPPSKVDSDIAIYRYYLRSVGSLTMIMFLLLQILWAFFTSFSVIWLRWWSEANDRQPNMKLGYYIGVYFGLQSAGALLAAIATWFCYSYMARASGLWLHDAMLRTALSAPMAYFYRTDTGSIMTRFSQDIQMADMNLPLQLLTFTQSLFVCIAQAGLIASASEWIVLAFPPLLLVFFGVQVYYLRTSKQLRLLDLSEKAPIYTQFLESLEGLATIRAFAWEHPLCEKNRGLVDRCQKPFYLFSMAKKWLNLVLDLVSMVLAVIVVVLAVRLRGSISAGAIGVSITQIISFASYIKQLINVRTRLEVSLSAISRIKQFNEETENEYPSLNEKSPPAYWPNKGRIEFKGVGAKYNSQSDHMALKDITLSIEPGQKVGICGRTGSGKSSLVLALFRMIELESGGSISIDSIDISTVPRERLRASINGLGQEAYLLEGTVRENLDPYGDGHDDVSMASVLEKVQLWSTVEGMGGLDVRLGPDSLSHGQRQLFCLARAMLRRSPILVLDEVTSNVDRRTDELMQKLIRDDFANQTVISIAHRLDNIRGCDKVAVMDGGACVEFEDPDELMKRDSRFKRLYETSGSEAKEI